MTVTDQSPALLIVNADDFGLTEGISEGILRAHAEGIVTSTSAIALGPAYPKVASRLADHEGLGVGVHLAAVGEDPPLLQRSEIPTLFDRQGRLSETWKGFLLRAVAGRIDPEDLRREFTAQLELVQEVGVPLTHLDAHQHLHLWPSVGKVVTELARRFEIPAVRVPHFRGLSPISIGVTALARGLAARARRTGLRFPADGVGIECAGHIDLPTLDAALARMAERGAPSVEITAHPGEIDDPDRQRYRWGYDWAGELAALTGPEARRAVAERGFVLATYADLPLPRPR